MVTPKVNAMGKTRATSSPEPEPPPSFFPEWDMGCGIYHEFQDGKMLEKGKK